MKLDLELSDLEMWPLVQTLLPFSLAYIILFYCLGLFYVVVFFIS